MTAALRRQKPWGCFHLGDKPESACGACTSMHSTANVQRAAMPRDAAIRPESGRQACLSGHLTANVQRTVKPRGGDRNGLIIMLVLSAKRRKNKNKSYEKHKTKYTKNIK